MLLTIHLIIIILNLIKLIQTNNKIKELVAETEIDNELLLKYKKRKRDCIIFFSGQIILLVAIVLMYYVANNF